MYIIHVAKLHMFNSINISDIVKIVVQFIGGKGNLTYRTESEMDVRFGRELQGDETGRYAVESYLDHQAQKLSKRFDANTYIALTEAMNSHDVGRDRGGVAAVLSKIKIPLHIVAIDTDRLFPPRLQQEIAELAPQVSTLHTISSPFGHDGSI